MAGDLRFDLIQQAVHTNLQILKVVLFSRKLHFVFFCSFPPTVRPQNIKPYLKMEAMSIATTSTTPTDSVLEYDYKDEIVDFASMEDMVAE